MTNGAMNVEIGNPAYKIYEGEQDDDVGELLDSDFTLDPDKVSGAEEPDMEWGHTHSTVQSLLHFKLNACEEKGGLVI